jgi:hypothetical protein
VSLKIALNVGHQKQTKNYLLVTEYAKSHFPQEVLKTYVISNLQNSSSSSKNTNIKSRGWLKHPNLYLYNLISAIENEFMKHVNSNTVVDDIIEGLITQYGSFTFTCTEHKDYIISFTIKYYINMRLRQYTRQSNQEKVKENAKKKIIQILYFLELLNYII